MAHNKGLFENLALFVAPALRYDLYSFFFVSRFLDLGIDSKFYFFLFQFVLYGALIATGTSLNAKIKPPIFSLKKMNQTDIKFLPHRGEKAFDSYLAINLPYEPVNRLRQKVSRKEGRNIKTRGEAHITVITPVEYFKGLKDYIKIQEIEKIAQEWNLQNTPYKILCLGRGGLVINGRQEYTYYLVISSSELFSFRKHIYDLFLKRGVSKGRFKANDYFPHITVGFTQRDFHQSDGVLKNTKTCWSKVVSQ